LILIIFLVLVRELEQALNSIQVQELGMDFIFSNKSK